MRRLLLFLVCAFLSIPAAALAHKPSDSYLYLDVDGSTLHGQWDIALRDLEYAMGLDVDGNGDITWGELRARHAALAAYALNRLEVQADGAVCPLAATEHLVDRHSDGVYSVLRFTANCKSAPKAVTLGYDLFFDLDPQHRGLLRLSSGEGAQAAVFAPQQREQTFELATVNGRSPFIQFGREGVVHIFIGYDHILFLLSLLLPAVMCWRNEQWVAVGDLRSAFLSTLKIVTAFTLAHSITLSLAVLDVVWLPARWVESAIAASVVLAALNNIYPVVDRRLWLVAFVFGLLHGFGFAGVLGELDLPAGALLPALFGFNLGVELGQVAIVAVFLPIAFALRKSWFYRRVAIGLGSLLIAGIGSFWMLERTLDLQLLS